MAKVLNMFREFSMNGVRGYKKLTNFQKGVFDSTYKKHLSSMDMSERMKYTENHVQKIEAEISILKVYYDHGESYFYMPGKKWVKIP